MVLCCGVCIEDVEDVLGCHRDSQIWMCFLHEWVYADDLDVHLICLGTGMCDQEWYVKQEAKWMREAKAPTSSSEKRMKRGLPVNVE